MLMMLRMMMAARVVLSCVCVHVMEALLLQQIEALLLQQIEALLLQQIEALLLQQIEALLLQQIEALLLHSCRVIWGVYICLYVALTIVVMLRRGLICGMCVCIVAGGVTVIGAAVVVLTRVYMHRR